MTKGDIRDFSRKKDDYVLEMVTNDMIDAETAQKRHMERFRRYYKVYKGPSTLDIMQTQQGRSGVAEPAHRSNVHVPYVQSNIDTLVPKVVLAMLRTKPYVAAIPKDIINPGERLEKAKKMTRLLDYQCKRPLSFIKILAEIVKGCAIYGTQITKQTWDYKEKVIKQRVPAELMGGTGMYEIQERLKVVRDDPKITLVPLLDFFFDPAATEIADARYCIHRYWADMAELESFNDQMEGRVYKNLNKLKKSLEEHDSTEATPRQAEYRQEKMQDLMGQTATNNANKEIMIWEYWTDDWVVKIANKEIVISCMPNPFWHGEKPFTRWVLDILPNEFYGVGLVERVEQLQYELNTVRNQRIDNVSLVINKMFKILRGANIDVKQLQSRPGGFIEVDSSQDVEEIPMRSVDGSAYTEEGAIKMDIDFATGIHDPSRGSSGVRRETATTMTILDRAGNKRFEFMVVIGECLGMEDCFNQIIALNKQYIDHERLLVAQEGLGMVDGAQIDHVSPMDLMGDWEIIAAGSAVDPYANSEVKQANLINLYGLVAQRPDFNHNELLREIFEAYHIPNVDRFFQNPMAMVQQMLMQQQAGQVPAQAPTPAGGTPEEQMMLMQLMQMMGGGGGGAAEEPMTEEEMLEEEILAEEIAGV